MRLKHRLLVNLLMIMTATVLFAGLKVIDLRAEELNNEEWIESEIPDEIIQYFEQDDYEVTCDMDENGNETWYLMNNLDGTRVKIADLNSIVSQVERVEAENAKLKSRIRKLIVTGICIIVIFTGALVGVIYMWRSEIPSNRRKKTKRNMAERKKNISKLKEYDVDGGYGAKAIKFVDEEDTK